MLKPCRSTLRLSVSEKLVPLTFLAGAEFIKAWLEVVKRTHLYPSFSWSIKIIFHCTVHALLCSCNIKYDNFPTLWNITCNENMKSGLLIYYDFSSSLQHPCMPRARTNRTGAIRNSIHGLMNCWMIDTGMARLNEYIDMTWRPLYGYYPSFSCGTRMENLNKEHWSTGGWHLTTSLAVRRRMISNMFGTYLKRSVSANPIL